MSSSSLFFLQNTSKSKFTEILPGFFWWFLCVFSYEHGIIEESYMFQQEPNHAVTEATYVIEESVMENVKWYLTF